MTLGSFVTGKGEEQEQGKEHGQERRQGKGQGSSETLQGVETSEVHTVCQWTRLHSLQLNFSDLCCYAGEVM